MEEKKHSPLPWVLKHLAPNNFIIISEKSGYTVVHKLCTIDDLHKVNGEFIVHACNNIERVTAERDELLDCLKVLTDRAKKDRWLIMVDGKEYVTASMAAIASVEGGQK